MSRIFFFQTFLIFLIFQGCDSLCSISGTYSNKNDASVDNYLKLNTDMTYQHTYKKGNITLSQIGNWKIKKDSYKGIELFQFCDYNENGINFKKYDVYILIIDGEYLNTGFDGNNEFSYKKEHR